MSQSVLRAQPSALFNLSAFGYVRHWLVAGPNELPYAGPPGPDHVLRRDALDYGPAAPPATGSLGAPGPFAMPWRFHDPGRNEFVEFSTFYTNLSVVEAYACTEITTEDEGERAARFWAAGAADLWVNDRHLIRLNVTRYRTPDFKPVRLPLRKGTNRLCVRLQCLGLRDTRMLFGLALEKTEGLAVRMAGADRIARAAGWIDEVTSSQRTGLQSAVPAPFDARAILFPGTKVEWPAGNSSLSFGVESPYVVTVEAEVDGVLLRRRLEIPANRSRVITRAGDRHRAHLEFVAKAGEGGETSVNWNSVTLPFMARRLLAREVESDRKVFDGVIASIDARVDCSDFLLAGLLRLELLGLCSAHESAEIRRAALAFRYWDDEPGSDAMCFRSENHSLLFHGCQLLAGLHYPKERFSNSGLTGEEQAALALPRIRKWLEKIERRGFEEFNSSTYMPVTIGAMLNIVDFCGDLEIAAHMSAQIDRIFRDLAMHAFGGGIISPQGRVYGDVLYPEETGTQVFLAFATEAAEVCLDGPRPPERGRLGDWIVYLASSLRYRPPADLHDLIRKPVSRIYRHADVQIVLEKTPAYLLSSLAVPATPRPGENPHDDLRPGGAGYQQHLWQATLGRCCHIFVNHPGGFFDGTRSRPGYWHGNGVLPRVRQEKNWLHAIYVIADGTKTEPEISPEVWEWGGPSTARPYDLHPIPFTHACWPAEVFDLEERRGNWIFGQKERGMIGLWCSEPLAPHDDVLTGCELRANAYASAWVVICGDLEQESLERFMERCEATQPQFDRAEYVLRMRGSTPTRWWERSEPMPR